MRQILLILILVVLAGCGSKGALFLPKDETAEAQPVSTQPEPAEAIDAQTLELPPTDELPAEEQATPQEQPEEDTIPEPLWEEEDDEDINL